MQVIKENTPEKTSKAEHTLFQKKVSEAKYTDTKAKLATKTKPAVSKTHTKQDVSVLKTTSKSSSPASRTVGQVLLKQEGRTQETRKGQTTFLTLNKAVHKMDPKPVKGGNATKTKPKSDQLKDEPQTNITQTTVKKMNGTTKNVTILVKAAETNKTRTGKDSLEQSTLKVDTGTVQSADTRKTDARKTGKGKDTLKSQNGVNTTVAATSVDPKVVQNKTASSAINTKKTGGSGLGSVKAVNISSYSFTVTWSAPQGMFKNFTVIRLEPRTEGDKDEHEEFEEDVLGVDKTLGAKNATEVLTQIESTNTTTSGRAAGSRGKAETRRISMVVPGNVRSVEFSNLRPNTRYVLYIYGSAAERRSKIHRVTSTTGNYFLVILP